MSHALKHEWVYYKDELSLFGRAPLTCSDFGIQLLPAFDANRNLMFNDAPSNAPMRCVQSYFGFDPRVVKLELHFEYTPGAPSNTSNASTGTGGHASTASASSNTSADNRTTSSMAGTRHSMQHVVWTVMQTPLHITFLDDGGAFSIENTVTRRLVTAICGNYRAPHERSYLLNAGNPLGTQNYSLCCGVIRRVIVHRIHLFANPRLTTPLKRNMPDVYWDGGGDMHMHDDDPAKRNHNDNVLI